MTKPKKLSRLIKYLILAVLLYTPLFSHLDKIPIRIWDESRLAINAYEMVKNGDYIVTHFEGKPDMWNTKPPLMIWAQVFFMKTIGIGELAVRLPSAIAALLTCVIIMAVSLRYLQSFWFGFIAVIVLITSNGYVNYHSSRTGDYDSMLAMFTTAAGMIYFAFLKTSKNKYLYLTFLFFALAVLTKSISGLLFIPGIAIYTLIQKKAMAVLRNKHFYFGLAGFTALTVGYYLLREHYNPGYINAVMYNDLGGRFTETLDQHTGDIWYYFDNFLNLHMPGWIYYFPAGLLVGLIIKDNRIVNLVTYSFILSFTFFLVISVAKTKLAWYDVPLYPFMAIIIGTFFYYIFDFIRNHDLLNSRLKYNVLPFIFLFIIFIKPYQWMINKTYMGKEFSWDTEFYRVGFYLKKALKGKWDCNNYFILNHGYNAHNKFYVYLLRDKGVNIDFKDYYHLDPGDSVIVHQQEVKDVLWDRYKIKVIGDWENVAKYVILGPKQDEQESDGSPLKDE